MRINTNISSIAAQRSVGKVNKDLEGTYAKLSSGQRVNKAADDAAGLAISEKLKADIRSSRQANRNANDGVSMVQTAEGGLNESSSILTRMRELAMQSASDTVSDSERLKTEIEYIGLKNELERISQVTEFNGRKLLDGSSEELNFHVGIRSNPNEDRISYNTNQVSAGTKSLGVDQVSISSKKSAQQSLAQIDQAINTISGQRSILGSIQNRLISSSNNMSVFDENMSAANGRIRDADYAVESANLARDSIIGQASTAVLSQANTSVNGALKLLG